jgi:phosphoglycolate phosphatase
MIKTILFDVDDTLVDTKGPKFQAIKFTGRKFYHLEISDKILNENYGLPIREFFDNIFNHIDNVDRILDNFMTVRDQFPSFSFPHSIETVNHLLKKYFIGVLSSASRQMILNDLKVIGYPLEKFTYIQSAEETNYHKPDPRVFDPAIEYFAKINIHKSEIAYVGDSIRDFEAASGAGLFFRGITARTTAEKDFHDRGAKTISDINELPIILDKII